MILERRTRKAGSYLRLLLHQGLESPRSRLLMLLMGMVQMALSMGLGKLKLRLSRYTFVGFLMGAI